MSDETPAAAPSHPHAGSGPDLAAAGQQPVARSYPLGSALGWAIPIFTLRFWPDRVRIHKPLTLLRFFAVVMYDILIANLAVAGLILAGPSMSSRPS
jgi:multisubunit Na+/H+ antiporter MnhE subunit